MLAPLAGLPATAAAKELARQGVATAHGGYWSAGAVIVIRKRLRGSKAPGTPARQGDSLMSERILMKFIVGQRVVKQGEDSRFEGEVVAAFVKRNLKTLRYVVENDDGVLHIASERQLRLAMPKAPGAA